MSARQQPFGADSAAGFTGFAARFPLYTGVFLCYSTYSAGFCPVRAEEREMLREMGKGEET